MKYTRDYSVMFRQILGPLVWVCQQKAAVRGGLGSAAAGLGELQKLLLETRTTALHTTRRGVRLALSVHAQEQTVINNYYITPDFAGQLSIDIKRAYIYFLLLTTTSKYNNNVCKITMYF